MSQTTIQTSPTMEMYDLVHAEAQRFGREEKFLKRFGTRLEFMKKIGEA